MTRPHPDIPLTACFARMVLIVMVTVTAAFAQSVPRAPDRIDPVPEPMRDATITEKLDNQLPLDLTFTDDQGREVRLGDYFQGKRPVVLALVYYTCPGLCTPVLNATVEALKEINYTPGEEYELVVISFDPNDTATLAAQKKGGYVAEFGRPGAAEGFHFLVGSPQAIRTITDAVGFGYKLDLDSGEYAHDAAITIITPDGRVARYIYGVLYDPRTVRLSLVEASQGKVGSTVDRVFLTCFAFDPDSNSYAATALGLVRWFGGGTMVMLAVAVGIFVYLGARRRARQAEAGDAGAFAGNAT
jgi:protein SCO1/2